jgi:hypothetical protein
VLRVFRDDGNDGCCEKIRHYLVLNLAAYKLVGDHAL